MNKIHERMVAFLRNEDGPTAVEYAIMATLVVIVCLVAIYAVGVGSGDTFDTVGSAMP